MKSAGYTTIPCPRCGDNTSWGSSVTISTTTTGWWGRWITTELAKGALREAERGACISCLKVWVNKHLVLAKFLAKLDIIPRN